MYWQVVVTPSHWSVVQAFPSLAQAVPAAAGVVYWQAFDAPLQRFRVQALPSSVQVVPEGWTASTGGQVVVTPSQVSTTSHTPPDERHTVPAAAVVFAWQPPATVGEQGSTVHAFPSLQRAAVEAEQEPPLHVEAATKPVLEQVPERHSAAPPQLVPFVFFGWQEPPEQ